MFKFSNLYTAPLSTILAVFAIIGLSVMVSAKVIGEATFLALATVAFGAMFTGPKSNNPSTPSSPESAG